MLKKATYYESIKELPMSVFIDIIESGNYTLLSKNGKWKEGEAIEIWNKIIQEYNEITESEGQKHVIQLLRFISLMDLKIRTISNCLFSLKLNFNSDIADAVSYLGIRSKITRINRFQAIKRAESELKRMVASMEEKRKELELIEKKNSNSDSSSNFQSVLLDLSKFQGYRIDAKDVTVFEFCLLLNKFKKHIKPVNKKKNGKQ